MSESGHLSHNRVYPGLAKPNTSNALKSLCLPLCGWKDGAACQRFILKKIKQGDNKPTSAFGEVEMGGIGSRIAEMGFNVGGNVSCTACFGLCDILHSYMFAIDHALGPKIIMIGNMVKDLLLFLLILVVFLLAYGVARQALLYPNEKNFGDIIVGIIYKPYLQFYGELFLDEISYNPDADAYTCSNNISTSLPRCPQTTAVVPILSSVYLLFANVLLLSLLIAMFSYTVDKVEKNGNETWKFQRYGLISSYCFRPPLAPPLIAFSHLFLFGHFVLGRICGRKKFSNQFSDKLKMELDPAVVRNLIRWEAWHAKSCSHKRREEEKPKSESQHKLQDRIDQLHVALKNLQERVETLGQDHREMSNDVHAGQSGVQPRRDVKTQNVVRDNNGLEALSPHTTDSEECGEKA